MTYAVLDLETTGFAYNSRDRICEIAVVLLDGEGRREGAWTTLVNPQRDLGAQHIHHIDATDARVAPTFDRIAGDVAHLLDGRVIVAHNAAFDVRFLVAEFARAGWPLDLEPEDALCTMTHARALGAPARLGDCCAHFDVPHDGAHTALGDAEATARLLVRYLEAPGQAQAWAPWADVARERPWPAPPRHGVTPVGRGAAAAGSALLAAELARFSVGGDSPADREYLALVERVLVDRRLSVDERAALRACAAHHSLSPGHVARLHGRYMMAVVEAVVADQVLTPAERALVIQLARLLGLGDLEVEALLAHARERAAGISDTLALREGDLVVLTGMSMVRKEALTRLARDRGLTVWPSVKKAVAAVIARDPGTASTKARKAREYGIPVVGEDALSG